MKLSDMSVDAPFTPKISRLFVFRFLWIFIEIWVLMVWAIWFSLVKFGQFCYMLVRGKRHRGMWNREMRFIRHGIKWYSYLNAITDRRPDFIEK